MYEDLAWHSTAMSTLIYQQGAGQHGLHFLIAEVRVAFPVRRELPCIVSDKLKASPVGVKNLTAARGIIVAGGMFLDGIAQSDIGFIFVEGCKFPGNTASLSIDSDTNSPHDVCSTDAFKGEIIYDLDRETTPGHSRFNSVVKVESLIFERLFPNIGQVHK
ncbi:MAG: hypothetical protein A4E65_03734 [Syntrophorhabdus sp. PtaU1.Bin153]|nr:MAG: hypothetical protein A4E65_03734 [Syntrophorhabdus sp. PtaU1.Bin153]